MNSTYLELDQGICEADQTHLEVAVVGVQRVHEASSHFLIRRSMPYWSHNGQGTSAAVA